MPATLALVLLLGTAPGVAGWGAGGMMPTTLLLLGTAPAATLAAGPLRPPTVQRGGGACSSEWDCSLGGACTAGRCACDHWTTGPQCNLLNLQHLKRDVSSYGLQMPGYHSWGGHAVADANGTWNGFFSFMCDHKTLSAWTTASSIVRATASSIDGPYTVEQMAVQPWAHNAYLAQDPPSKEHLLFHIGTAVAPEAGWSPCVIPNASTHEPQPAPPAPKCNVSRTGNLAIRSASSLLGPWTPLSSDPCSVNGGVEIEFNEPWSQFIAGELTIRDSADDFPRWAAFSHRWRCVRRQPGAVLLRERHGSAVLFRAAVPRRVGRVGHLHLRGARVELARPLLDCGRAAHHRPRERGSVCVPHGAWLSSAHERQQRPPALRRLRPVRRARVEPRRADVEQPYHRQP